MDAATGPQDRGLPDWGFHPLKGELASHWSIWVNGNWRCEGSLEEDQAGGDGTGLTTNPGPTTRW
ncbi:MAG TPA: type II toxin-antitoxin system RelE/ParE family toxin [Polyangia bacterium]